MNAVAAREGGAERGAKNLIIIISFCFSILLEQGSAPLPKKKTKKGPW